MKLTAIEQKKYERTAYVALDAVDRLVGHGLGGENTCRALDAIRQIINDIQNAEKPERKSFRRAKATAPEKPYPL